MTVDSPKRAIISVFHKIGIEDFARRLIALGFQIVSSGGTADHLRGKDLPVTDVAEITGMPAILGHRVVTLHPKILGGLLAKKEHRAELAEHGIPWFDLACVDLYPLESTILGGSTETEIIEKIDIGGPTIISSAAKGRRIVICDPADRRWVLDWIEAGCPDEENVLRRLAAKADFVVSHYRGLSARHFGRGEFEAIHGTRAGETFKGENGPQSPAALYDTGENYPLAVPGFRRIGGVPLSHNNWVDLERALQTATHVAAGLTRLHGSTPLIALGIKHGNACGAAVEASDKVTAVKNMIAGDRVAIFGGLVLVNFKLDEDCAHVLNSHLVEGDGRRILDVVVAPSFTPGAVELLSRKGGRCRLVTNPDLGSGIITMLDYTPRYRHVRGGFLLQPNYAFVLDWEDPDLVKYGEFKPEEIEDLILAWALGATSTSNTITIVYNRAVVGNAVGQQSRVDAAKLAVAKAKGAGHRLEGAVAYSDSFFPFPDGPQVLAEAGVKAILASSGSVNDGKVVDYLKGAGVKVALIPDAKGRGFYGH